MSSFRAFAASKNYAHPLAFVVLAVACVLVGGCGMGVNDAADNGSSVPYVGPGAGEGGTTPTVNPNGAATSPNTGTPAATTPSNPNGFTTTPASPNTTPGADPNVVALLAQTNANATYGVGFALQAVDYPGYCLAAANAGAPANSPLRLAECANTTDQAFAWSTGHFALNKSTCLSGPVSNGSLVTLQSCQVNVQQNWLLPPDTQLVSRLLPSTTTVQALAIDPGSYQSSQVFGQLPGAGGGLRLSISPLAQTDGIRIHAKVNGTDLCLQDAAPVAKLTGCGAGGGVQVWRLVVGQWRSASGHCLIADLAARTVSAGACSAQPATNAQWTLIGGFVTPVAAVTNPTTTSLVLDVDTASSTFKLSPPAGLTPLVAIAAQTGLF